MRQARPPDAAALAELLLRNPQEGRMVLGQDRAPDPFARRRPFDDATTIVVDDDGGLAATGTCATKRVLVEGAEVTAAYIFDMAVDARARRRGLARRILEALEGWARGRDAAFAYAHVIPGNASSVTLFDRADFTTARELTGRVYPVFGRRPGPPEDARPVSDWDAAAVLMGAASARHDLVRPLDGDALRTLWTSLPGWRDDDLWTTQGALLGLWDHSEVARAVPLRLPPEVRALGVAGRVARGLRIPFPRAPELGRPLRYGYLVGGAGIPKELGRLLSAVLGRAGERGLEFVVHLHDRIERPRWTKAAFSVPDVYRMLAKPLGGPAPGDRPVVVDPIDL